MDVEFIYDTINKRHSIEIQGEQAVVARFLSAELEVKSRNTSAIEALILELSQHDEKQLRFVEWTLDFDNEEVRVRHNSLFHNEADHPEFGAGSADWQLATECGKEDMIALLVNWVEFVSND